MSIQELWNEAKKEAQAARVASAEEAERDAETSGNYSDWYYAAGLWKQAGNENRASLCMAMAKSLDK